MFPKLFTVLVLAGNCVALGARAEPLPAGVEAMIREAAKGDEIKAVVKVAKASNPNSVPEIDALVASLEADAAAAREERLAHAGFFDSWSGSGSVGFSTTSGNTRDTGITLGIALAKDGLKFRHKLNGMVDRQTSSGTTTRSRYLANYELNYKVTERLYAYGLVGWDRDPFAGYSRRFSESVGAGYSVLKSDTMLLDLSAGPALRQTRYVDGTRANDTTARAALDFNWKILDKLVFSENAAIYFGNQIVSTTALTGGISDKLSARISFDVTREQNPRAGRKSTDTATRASLVYGF